MNFLTNLNLNRNELQNVVMQNLAQDPETPKLGQFWYNTTTSKFCFYDGEQVCAYLTESDAVANYQTKITATGILKGTGSGSVTAAVAGTDYGYAVLQGSTDPTDATEAAVTQHYLNLTTGVEFVCTSIDDSDTPVKYVWQKVSSDESKQDKITATGILKGAGAGVVTAAVADTDYQSPITVTASRALVSDGEGKVAASTVTATELGYLSGVTSNIQDQLDAIPKLNYLDGVECEVADDASQSAINAAAIGAISEEYASPDKWDAVNVAITFTPSDKVKNGLYYYDGSEWSFLYYTSTGIQLASGTIAGLIQEADVPEFAVTETYSVGDKVKHSAKFYVCIVDVDTAGDWTGATNWAEIPYVSDLSLNGGVATVNCASELRTARTISVQGNYGATPSVDGISATGASFNGSGNATIIITGIKPEMLSGEVPVSLGGTGKTSITSGKLLVGNASGGFDELGVDTEVTAASANLITSGAVATAIGGGNVAHAYSENNDVLTATNNVCTWTVTHSLNKSAVTVQVYEVTSGHQVIPEITITSANVVTLSINSATDIAADTYRVVVVG